jgi:hypothetical protein
LAIRNVYREGGFRDPHEERKAAALAADDAPNNPELMAQGKAIFEKEEAQRKWNNAPIPVTKAYNDPAYALRPAGGKRRKTVKRKTRSAKKTTRRTK